VIPTLATHTPAPTLAGAPAAGDDLLTRLQVQRRLNISRETLLRWIRLNKFPAADVRNGNWKRWYPRTLDAWIADHSRVRS
jgi:predicted DNA-binding transcriptional regulator AlpA